MKFVSGSGAIDGVAAIFYSLVPGNLARATQRRLAQLTHAALTMDAALVVDAGCGPGWLAIEFAKLRPRVRVIGVDLSPMMIRIARFNARRRMNVDMRVADAASLSLDDDAADMIVSAESMHHWRSPVAILDEFHRVLKPGGRAWIFDGRTDFTPEDLRGWTLYGQRVPPRRALEFIRRILSIHGFSNAEWEQRIPEWIHESRFKTGIVTPLGIYRHIELVKSGS